MKSCSQGISNGILCVGLNRVIVSVVVPYSCWFLKICWAYADWGVVISDVADVFAVSLCQVSTGLTYICHVACLAGEFVYPTSIIVGYFFWVLGYGALM